MLYQSRSFSERISRPEQALKLVKMNKSIILILLPCLVAFVMAQQYGYQSGYQSGYPAYYQNQLNAYTQQRRLYNYGNAATAQLKGAKLLNYLFGFLLLLDVTNATGNSLNTLG